MAVRDIFFAAAGLGGEYAWITNIQPPDYTYYYFNNATKAIKKQNNNYFVNGVYKYTGATPASGFGTIANLNTDGTVNWTRSVGTLSNGLPYGIPYNAFASDQNYIYGAGAFTGVNDSFLAKYSISTGTAQYLKIGNSYANSAYSSADLTTDGTKIALGGTVGGPYPCVFVIDSSTLSPIITLAIEYGGTTYNTVRIVKWLSNTDFFALTTIGGYSSSDLAYVRGTISGSTVYSKRINMYVTVYSVTNDSTYAYVVVNDYITGASFSSGYYNGIVKINMLTGEAIWSNYYTYNGAAMNTIVSIAVDSTNGDIYAVSYNSSGNFIYIKLNSSGNFVSAWRPSNSSNYPSGHQMLLVDSEEKHLIFGSDYSNNLRIASVPLDLSKMSFAESGYEWIEDTGTIGVINGNNTNSPIVANTATNWVSSTNFETLTNFSSWYYPAYNNGLISTIKEITV